jgi:6-pyruvoyltetrahydropterin/6-carboxytetrahydropterin synthase
LEVTVCGVPDELTGYVIDLKKMKSIIQDKVIDIVDHKNLNVDVSQLNGIVPTSENLVMLFWRLLDGAFPNAKLHKIKLSESATSSVEYFGNANEGRCLN